MARIKVKDTRKRRYVLTLTRTEAEAIASLAGLTLGNELSGVYAALGSAGLVLDKFAVHGRRYGEFDADNGEISVLLLEDNYDA